MTCRVKFELLFVFDVVVFSRRGPRFNQAIESIRKISSLDIDRLFCYYGGVEGDVKKKLMKLLGKYQKSSKLY